MARAESKEAAAVLAEKAAELPGYFADSGIQVNKNVNAGRYVHGGGIQFKGSNGTYTYAEGRGIDIYNFDWDKYWDADVNVPNF